MDKRPSVEQRLQHLEVVLDAAVAAISEIREEVKYLMSLQPKGKGALNPAMRPEVLRKNGLL